MRLVARRTTRRLKDGGRRRLLILPADPADIFGSRGDQAMLETIRAEFRQRFRVGHVGIVTSSPAAIATASSAGFIPEEIWPPHFDLIRAAVVDYDYVVIIGADVMDGYYCPEVSKSYWNFAEISQLAGAQTRIMGCSFNAAPAQAVIDLIRSLHAPFLVNFRDPVSHRRFAALFERKANLVADLAFLLKPTSDPGDETQKLIAWTKSHQAGGSLTIGLNMNTHLFRGCGDETIQAAIESVAQALLSFCQSQDTVLVLLPHDIRPASRDEDCLLRLHKILAHPLGERIKLLRGEPTAAELKLAVGMLDVLVTGRMHLGIAALSQGVATAAITYQGKFSGLLDHFGLPEWLLLSPEDTADSQKVENLLHRLVRERNELSQTIRTNLPHVIDLAGKNFD